MDESVIKELPKPTDDIKDGEVVFINAKSAYYKRKGDKYVFISFINPEGIKDSEIKIIRESQLNEEESKYSIGDKVKTNSGETGEITAINSNDSTVDILKDDGKTSTLSFDQISSREKEIQKEENDQEGIEDKDVIKDKE
jgi:preprotein translocase subunit YajC